MMWKNWRLLAVLVTLAGALGAAAGEAAGSETVSLFDGKTLNGWAAREPVAKNKWKVASARLDREDPNRLVFTAPGAAGGVLVNDAMPKPKKKEDRAVDIYCLRNFGDCTIELEFMVPEGANSGVYVMGEYEVQIKDNYGKEKLTYQEMGAVYKVAAARVNACQKPGQWQSMRIEFLAPRFEGDRKVANARLVKVVFNGQLIHENLELTDVTPGGLTGKEVPTGPLMFQGDHGPVAFRKIQVTLP